MSASSCSRHEASHCVRAGQGFLTFFLSQGRRLASAGMCAGVSGYFVGKAKAWATTRDSISHWSVTISDRIKPARTSPRSAFRERQSVDERV